MQAQKYDYGCPKKQLEKQGIELVGKDHRAGESVIE
jgi:hypothetical protein